MKYLKYILLLLLIIVVGGAIYIATLNNSYNIKRTKLIKAPVQVVFDNINDYKNWPSWSPWIEQDTLTQLTYGNKTSGVGASYTWKSDLIGEGNMETTEVIDNQSINQTITFVKPWESTSDIYWNFKPTDDGTEVTWGMKGNLDFMEKAYMTFSGGMDKQIGVDYERGLAKLDSVIQVNMKKYTITVNGLTAHSGGYYLYNTTSCSIDDMQSKMQELMPKVLAYIKKHNIPMAGAPFVLYLKYDTENNAVIFSCAAPVSDRVITDSQDIQTGILQPFNALKTTLKGNYTNLEEAWNTAMEYIDDKGLKEAEGKPYLEVYQTDPTNTPNPADWITEIYIPIVE